MSILFSIDSGATVLTAIKVLLEHGVKEKNILLLNVFATPKGDIDFALCISQISGKMLST